MAFATQSRHPMAMPEKESELIPVSKRVEKRVALPDTASFKACAHTGQPASVGLARDLSGALNVMS